MSRDTGIVAVFAALLLWIEPVSAADQLARLTIDVTVEGSKTWKSGQDYANSNISEQYHLVTHLMSSGEPSSVNTRDPQFAQKQMAIAAGVQQKLREAQARAGQPVPKPAATHEEYVAQQRKLIEDLQKGQIACEGDPNCLMQLAQEYAEQSAMLGYPPADGAERTAGLEASGVADEEDRYLDYFGYEGCPGDIHIRINNTSGGATADVSGMVPFKQADTADYRGNELNVEMQCLGSNLVFDLKTNRIYTDGIGHPAPRGSFRYWDSLHGETLNEDTDVKTNAIAWEWVASTLRIADAAGSASTTLPIHSDNAGAAPAGVGGDGSGIGGEIQVTMSWTFERL